LFQLVSSPHHRSTNQSRSSSLIKVSIGFITTPPVNGTNRFTPCRIVSIGFITTPPVNHRGVVDSNSTSVSIGFITTPPVNALKVALAIITLFQLVSSPHHRSTKPVKVRIGKVSIGFITTPPVNY